MKYIRTKDSIIDFAHLTDFTKARITEANEKEHFIVKFGDTIERLCDRFVVIYKNEEPVPYKNYLDAVATQKDIYGAIWTDKGLIYVAKMNDKGELELL